MPALSATNDSGKVRLVVSLDGATLGYSDASNARAPFVSLGVSSCGGSAHAPGVQGGWCAPDSPDLAHTSFDTSATYMASGYVPSADGASLYFYSSGQPMTHGGDGTHQSWANNTGLQLLRVRRDGFVAVEAPYDFAAPPHLTTVELRVPSHCAPPARIPGPARSGCAFEYPGQRCPAALPPHPCATDADCQPTSGSHFTCHGATVRCLAPEHAASGGSQRRCASGGDAGDVLCLGNVTRLVGGVELLVNMETSVAGFVAVEVLSGGRAIVGFDRADRLKGNAIAAVASWDEGATASLSALAGTAVSFRVTLADAKLYSLRLACAGEEVV